MKLGIVSDLHLSRAPQAPPRADADAWVLAGDIARPADAIAWARALERPVFYVPGNHEFYGGALPQVVQELRALAAGSQVRILDNEEAVLGGVRFLGSTLWTDFLLDGDGEGLDRAMQEAAARLHDFRRIRLDTQQPAIFSPLDAIALFRRNAAWLQDRLQRPWPGRTVVITHHAPSARSLDPRFPGSPLNPSFASDLEHLMHEGGPHLWVHGHLHHSVDYACGGTRVLSNPRGYWSERGNENPSFDIDLVVDLDALPAAA